MANVHDPERAAQRIVARVELLLEEIGTIPCALTCRYSSPDDLDNPADNGTPCSCGNKRKNALLQRALHECRRE